jgi:hypothetical protein
MNVPFDKRNLSYVIHILAMVYARTLSGDMTATANLE